MQKQYNVDFGSHKSLIGNHDATFAAKVAPQKHIFAKRFNIPVSENLKDSAMKLKEHTGKPGSAEVEASHPGDAIVISSSAPLAKHVSDEEGRKLIKKPYEKKKDKKDMVERSKEDTQKDTQPTRPNDKIRKEKNKLTDVTLQGLKRHSIGMLIFFLLY